MHVTGAADELVRHVADQSDALAEDGSLMTLARAGAHAMATRAELAGTASASAALSGGGIRAGR